MKASKLLSVIAAFSMLSLTPVLAQNTPAEPVEVQAELLPTQTLPVRISEARLMNFDTGSNLQIGLTNAGKVSVSKIWVEVFISHDGSMRRGEGTLVDLADAAPGQTFPLSVTLNSRAHLVPGDTALVFLSRVQGPTGTAEVPRTDRLSMLKEFVQGQFNGNFSGPNDPNSETQATGMLTLEPSSISSGPGAVQPDVINCQTAVQDAKDICGSRGIHSFTCSATSWSVTCNGS